ncbi:bicaudal D-related protein 1-like isoform X2, partial [Clarias magur]
MMDLEEDFYPYGDGGEARAALRRKEEELVLAAQLGNALLSENLQLKEENNKLQEEYTEKIEELEQDRHNLRLKLQGCQAQWENQVGELERDVRALNAHAERLTLQLSETKREKSLSEEQHNEMSQQLQDQLQETMEVKMAVTAELQSLKQELGERGHPRPQDEELLSALKEQVARMAQQEQSLEQRLETVCEENAKLRDNMTSLYERLALQEQQSNMQAQQLAEAWQEVELAKDRAQDLQSQIEELQEEVSLQRTIDEDTSLLSEMEHSVDAINWNQDRERITQEVSSILEMLLPVSHGSEALCNQDESLQSKLGQLKSAAERIVHNETLQELKRPIVGGDTSLSENTALIQELRDQNAQLLKENSELQDGSRNQEIIQRAIKDRDDAISKKTAVEAELVRSRNDMMYLNNQLLEAIQRKLELSQELEAWQ